MLKDKTIFISGGTGYLGQELCRSFAEYGARVIFSYYNNSDAAESLQSELSGVKAVKINLSDLKEIKAVVEDLHKEYSQIDVLVNNAGASQVMPFSMIEEEDVDYLLNVNVKGPVFLTKAVLRHMIRNQSGSIVNIGSIAGHRILEVPVHYALSKAAISGFTCSLAAEVKRFGIRVNSVVPGLLEDGVSRGIPEELRDDFNRHCLTGRPGTAKEVADTVCFLASDRASYINGQNIFVDGGI